MTATTKATEHASGAPSPQPAALSDREIARYVIDFANSATYRPAPWMRNAYEPVLRPRPDGAERAYRGPRKETETAEALRRQLRVVIAMREGIRDPAQRDGLRDFLEALAKDASRVSTYPAVQISTERERGGRWRVFVDVQQRLVRASLHDLLQFGVLLMADNRRGCDDLRECKLPECGRFYLANDARKAATGRKPDAYCCHEHADKARRTMNTESSKRSRANKRATRAEGAARAKRRKV